MSECDVIEPMIAAETIADRVDELVDELRGVYAGREPLFLTVLEGGAPFADAICARWEGAARADVGVSSYGGATSAQTEPQLTTALPEVAGRDVLVIDDVFDTGHTLSMLKQRLLEAGAASVALCVLLSKKREHEHPMQIDYIGFEIPDVFVIGFGLDYDGVYRDLPYVGVLTPGSVRV